MRYIGTWIPLPIDFWPGSPAGALVAFRRRLRPLWHDKSPWRKEERAPGHKESLSNDISDNGPESVAAIRLLVASTPQLCAWRIE